MEFNFDSYISLDVKKARENYGDKDDTYSNMIKSFYDNVLNQNLKTIQKYNHCQLISYLQL